MVEINTETTPTYILISIKGEVDASSSIYVDDAIQGARQQGFKNILINTTDLDYISSAGLGVFMSYIQDFDAEGVKLIIYGLNLKVLNVFQILGLDQLLRIAESKEEAERFINEL